MMEWIKKNDIGSKALALLFAIFVWFYVVSTTNPDMSQTYTNVPVTLIGTEALTASNLVITNGAQSSVNFKVIGKSDKISKISGSENFSVTADLSTITGPGTYEIRYLVSSNVTDITITKTTPNLIIEVDRNVSKSISVDVQFTGKLADGYISNNHTISPDAITVSGPEKLLETITKAVATFDVTDIKVSKDATLSYKLVNGEGVPVESIFITTDVASIKLTYEVSQVGEIPIVLNTKAFGFIDEEHLSIKLEPSTIKINGNPNVFDTLNRIDLGPLDLKTVFESEIFEYDLPIILPNGVSSEDNITSVKVTITAEGIAKNTIEIPRDKLPQSSVFEYTEGLIITYWTLSDNQASINHSSFDIVLSYVEEELVEGRNEIPVTITPLVDNVAVAGKYTVIVDVKR